MEVACDFCEESRATVYCRADSALLCLLCDRHVHGANAISRRHHRTLLCDACNLRPAAVRCTVDNVALCQSCNWDSHGSSVVASQHKRQPFDCFSGCPSAEELGSLWGCEVLSGLESGSDAAPPKLAGFKSGSWGAQTSAGPSGAPDASRTSSAAQSLEYSVPNVRASPGKVATFASMSGAGPPLLAKSSIPTSTVMMGKGGHGSKLQQSREAVVQQLQKLEVLDPQVQMQSPMLLQTSKKHPISFPAPPLEPSRAFGHQKKVQQQQQKTPLNQLLSNQQQTANLQKSSQLSQLLLNMLT